MGFGVYKAMETRRLLFSLSNASKAPQKGLMRTVPAT